MSNISGWKEADGRYEVEYIWRTYRYLLSDGRVMDVRAIQDGSHLRETVLKIAGITTGGKIEGTATLPEPEEVPETAPKAVSKLAGTKKAAPKRAAAS